MSRKIIPMVALAVAALLVLPARPAQAAKANVLSAKVYAQSYAPNPPWLIVAAVQYQRKDRSDRCDAVRATSIDGRELKSVEIKRPFGRRPFTQSLGGVRAPTGSTKIVVEAKSKAEGWGGRKLVIDLAQDKGQGYEIIKGDALKQHIHDLIENCRAKSGKDMKGLMAAKASREQLAAIGRVCVPQLLGYVDDENWVVRWSALDVLASVGSKQDAVGPLLKAYNDKNGMLRSVAINLAARFLKDPEVQKATFAKMDSPGGEKKWATKALLARPYTRAKAIDKLKALASSKSAGSRAFAFTTLVDVDKKLVRDEAVNALKTDKNAAVLSAAMDYLKAGNDTRPQTIEAIKGLLKAPQPQTRGEACMALFTLAPDQAYEYALETLKTEKDGKARRFMMGKMFQCKARDNRIIELCLAGLRDNDIRTRGLCYKALRVLTGQRLPYYPESPPAYRDKFAKGWEKWWAENKATFKLPALHETGRPSRRRH